MNKIMNKTHLEIVGDNIIISNIISCDPELKCIVSINDLMAGEKQFPCTSKLLYGLSPSEVTEAQSMVMQQYQKLVHSGVI